ncbi:hypothetical protein GA0115233_101781 [Streptomyces sp. DI166]|uniref:hypothetical protein n=1 Tax=Streptomyces sp. DI166 TaxID=1839783 RepID=UPI0007F389A3|nr:hypothetical protein [Streptomyces sp. DI166]SBT90344.1 hypothetical protein GA0115233_101781 [Streptomyces sp. DI166]
MAYVLQAVIAADRVLRTAARDLPAARPAPLAQGLSLMPLTDALRDALAGGDNAGTEGFWRLPAGLAGAASAWSATGPVAYVEAEYFGGTGEQHAVVWDRGALALGPLHVEEGQSTPAVGSPISQALRRLGVVVGGGDEDEFAAVGLGRRRSTSAWLA